MGGFDGWLGRVVWCSMDAGLVVVVVVYLLHIFTYLPTYPYLIPRGIFLFCFFRWAHITPLPYLQYLSTLYSHRLGLIITSATTSNWLALLNYPLVVLFFLVPFAIDCASSSFFLSCKPHDDSHHHTPFQPTHPTLPCFVQPRMNFPQHHCNSFTFLACFALGDQPHTCYVNVALLR